MSDKELEELAEEAKLVGENDLAIVLYTYLGSKHVGMGSDFARYCQTFAEEGIRELNMYKNRGRN